MNKACFIFGTSSSHRSLIGESERRRQQRKVVSRVVLSDVLGGKDVVERRDGRTNGRTCRILIGRIRVKTELPPQIRFYILSLTNTIG
jgi:hypothetical protein